ncbi:MAG: RagB/SusD family nutrient uptake outer membrane protein [Prevotella sp.]|nr:RagB/SusD family nutrient uptake outer membrane protein [Prevotella sp.]
MKTFRYIMATILLFQLSGCSDFLEERSQDTYYVSSYKDLDELLIGDCYLPVYTASPLADTNDMGYFIHYLADEIEEQNGSLYSYAVNDKETIFGYYTWQQRVGETHNHVGYRKESSTWTETYRLINVANNILDALEKVDQNTERERLGVRRVSGEAHFLRAAYYFWLVNLYAKPYVESTASTDLGVPLKTISKVNDIIYQRNTVKEVYDQILKDLKQAEEELSGTPEPATPYRANLTAVQFLIARVYLYMQKWDLASAYASKVLERRHQLVDLNSDNEPFLRKGSVENIFSMGGAEIPASMCNIYQSFRVSHDLYNAYRTDDIRKKRFWWTYEDFVGYTKLEVSSSSERNPEDSYFYQDCYYYPILKQKSSVSDKFLYRTAEAYLIKAEAEAMNGNEAEARNILNQLRKCRFRQGSAYEITASGENLIKAIREERRLELALEGHRWFDLRRYSVCAKYPESKEIVHDYTYYEDDTEMKERHRFVLKAYDAAYTLPIPHEVLDFNTGMPNNERPEREFTIVPL